MEVVAALAGLTRMDHFGPLYKCPLVNIGVIEDTLSAGGGGQSHNCGLSLITRHICLAAGQVIFLDGGT